MLPTALLAQGYALRPEAEDDVPFLMHLYGTTRAEEVAQMTMWTAEQQWAFIAQQFEAQRHHYRTFQPDCAFDIIEHRGQPVGRLYLQTRQTQLHITDIALLPEYRGQGLGTALLQWIMARGTAAGLGVGIFVEKFNPALALYQRLGFTPIRDAGVYLEMEWGMPEGLAALPDAQLSSDQLTADQLPTDQLKVAE